MLSKDQHSCNVQNPSKPYKLLNEQEVLLLWPSLQLVLYNWPFVWLNSSPCWQTPLQCDGIGGMPSSLKLSDSGQTPKEIIFVFTNIIPAIDSASLSVNLAANPEKPYVGGCRDLELPSIRSTCTLHFEECLTCNFLPEECLTCNLPSEK
ncbi:hypothetical protein F8388_020212 [Cannabis sativa]|uniref:Uncharacterized protein n=1 Tax=Cannabis sativa TaxID=3483 RepID=A0A7J6FVB3_CANSA|nr:hypothetical protein F8388_020212 [Cannabis sativa]